MTLSKFQLYHGSQFIGTCNDVLETWRRQRLVATGTRAGIRIKTLHRYMYTDPSKCINDHTLRSDTEFCRTSILKLSDKILPGRSESLHSQIVKL